MDLPHLVLPYSPWFSPTGAEEWKRQRQKIPRFRRPIYDKIVSELDGSGQILSVTGPRRVGKSTLLRQFVLYLLDKKKVSQEKIIYYSFDDAALYLRELNGGDVLEAIMDYALKTGEPGAPCYLLFDEIQTLPAWELYLKKYYDLKYPVRIVVSGSASSPIFKKSRESLLGRITDHHLLPFSFREYLMYRLQGQSEFLAEIGALASTGESIRGMFARDPQYVDLKAGDVPDCNEQLWKAIENHLGKFMVEGGFPETWSMSTQEEKLDYLFSNQVTKVIMEDLVLAAEFRKPEQLKKFYISLLEQPGREVNMSLLSQELGINVQQIDKYLPLLEMTDLIRHADKFRPSAVRVHQGRKKFYPIDLALRNAVLRLGNEILEDSTIMGAYAETLVFNALKKWPGVLGVDYYREGQSEVDFVVHTRHHRYLPVEVKYKNRPSDAKGIMKFKGRYKSHLGLVVTKKPEHFGRQDEHLFQIPLGAFLLLFD